MGVNLFAYSVGYGRVTAPATRDALDALARPLARRILAGGGALTLGLLLAGLGVVAWLAQLEVRPRAVVGARRLEPWGSPWRSWRR